MDGKGVTAKDASSGVVTGGGGLKESFINILK